MGLTHRPVAPAGQYEVDTEKTGSDGSTWRVVSNSRIKGNREFADRSQRHWERVDAPDDTEDLGREARRQSWSNKRARAHCQGRVGRSSSAAADSTTGRSAPRKASAAVAGSGPSDRSAPRQTEAAAAGGGRCSKTAWCLRGFRHGGHGGYCNARPPDWVGSEDEGAASSSADPGPVARVSDEPRRQAPRRDPPQRDPPQPPAPAPVESQPHPQPPPPPPPPPPPLPPPPRGPKVVISLEVCAGPSLLYRRSQVNGHHEQTHSLTTHNNTTHTHAHAHNNKRSAPSLLLHPNVASQPEGLHPPLLLVKTARIKPLPENEWVPLLRAQLL